MKYFNVIGKRASGGTPIDWYICAPDEEILRSTLYESEITVLSITEIEQVSKIALRSENLEILSLENKMGVPADLVGMLKQVHQVETEVHHTGFAVNDPAVAEAMDPEMNQEIIVTSSPSRRTLIHETRFQHQRTGWIMLITGLNALILIGIVWLISALVILFFSIEVSSDLLELENDSLKTTLAVCALLQASCYFLLSFNFVWIVLGGIFYFSGLIKQD